MPRFIPSVAVATSVGALVAALVVASPAFAESTDPTVVPTTAPTSTPVASVPVGPGELERTFVYRCEGIFWGLNLGTHSVSVRATADYPELAAPGDVLAPRSASVELELSELLRQSVHLLLNGTSYEGTADADWTLTTAGRATAWDTGDLVFPRAPIPEEMNEPWRLPGRVELPAVTVPDEAEGALWLSLPQRFTLAGQMHTTSGETHDGEFTCTAPADRVLGGVALEGSTDPTPPPPDPTTDPTPDPDPTTDPTPDPTPDPTDPTPDPTFGPFPDPSSPAPVGPGTLTRTVTYWCGIVTGGLDLGVQRVDVRATVDYPEVAAPGDVLPARQAELVLRPQELLRQSTTLLLGAREFEASSQGSAWSFTTADRTTAVQAGDIVAPRSGIPQDAGRVWNFGAQVVLPALTVPGDTAGGLWLNAPDQFTLDGTFRTSDLSTIPATMDCAASGDRRVGGIALEGWTYPTSPPTTIPTTPTPPTTPAPTDPTGPTVEPTTQPTTAPTTQPTTGPVLLQPSVKVGALALWRSAVFTVGVSAKGTLPSGNVTVRLGDRSVAKGRLFLGVTVLTASNLPKGQHTFTISYEGDAKVAGRTVTKVLRIN
ncbi:MULTISPECIES: Ig-like domain-containing protein [Aeromicrobium]|uniref:Ig-like domain-containing protein n=1 Tax=Aeromicrobium TaxID=2040 RepID=UPI00257F3C70|nr:MULTISPECIES: Ig-like domain-containing protein [Aeromicrobium]